MSITSASSASSAPSSAPERKTYHTKVMDKDVGEILDAYKEAQQKKIDKKQAVIDDIDKRVERLSTLEEKLKTLQQAASTLYGKGIGRKEGGAFSKLVPVLGPGPDDVLSVTTNKDAVPTEMSIEVRQLAQKDRVVAALGVADPKSALGWSGSFNLGSGEKLQTIDVDPTMSINDVRQAVNDVSKTTGIEAKIITFSDEARLTFQATQEADPIIVDTSALEGDDATTILPATSARTVAELSALVRYEGIEKDVMYPTNRVPAGDQYAGVSLDLIKARPGEVVNISLQNDRNAAGNAILEFVDAFNDYQEFASSKEMYKEGGLPATLSRLAGTLTGHPSNLGAEAKTLHNLGIQLAQPRSESGKILTDKKPLLSVNIETLTAALQSNFDQVAKIFGEANTSTHHSFKLINRPDTVAFGDVEATLTKSAGNVYSATLTYDGETYTATMDEIHGDVITFRAPKNSPLKGFAVLFNDLDALPNGQESTRTTTISMTQGVVDKLSQELNGLLNPKNGALQQERDALASAGDRKTADLDRVKERQARDYERLQNKFQIMETVAAKLKQVQKFIEAFLATGKKS